MFSARLFAAATCLFALIPSTHAAELPIVGTGDGIPVLTAVGQAFTAENRAAQIVRLGENAGPTGEQDCNCKGRAGEPHRTSPQPRIGGSARRA